jgi:hypothetical protein
MDRTAAERRISDQDVVVGRLAQRVLRPGVIASTGLLGVRLTEKRHPSDIIEILSGVAP